MEQVIIGGYYDLLSTSTKYNSLCGGLVWGIPTLADQVVSTAGKIKSLRVKLDASPGVGKSYTFTLMLNGGVTALECTIADDNTTGSDVIDEIAVVAGDYVYLRVTSSGSPTARYATWTGMFEGTTAKESLILSKCEFILSNTTIEYAQLYGITGNPSATENDFRQVCPTAGKIKNLYLRLSSSPGIDPHAYRFTLRKGGISQTLTVTVTAPASTGNDVINEVTVAAGDVLTMMIEPLNSPANTPNVSWGATFVADTDGESIIMGGSLDELHWSDTEYNFLTQTWIMDWLSTENQRYNLGQACTLKKLYILLSGAPGGIKSYIFTLRKAAGDGNLTVTIAGAATTGNDVVNTDIIANFDYLDLKCVPVDTPFGNAAYWGLVCYITGAPPPPTGIADKSATMGNKMVGVGLI